MSGTLGMVAPHEGEIIRLPTRARARRELLRARRELFLGCARQAAISRSEPEAVAAAREAVAALRAVDSMAKAARQLSVSAGGSFPRIWGKQRGARGRGLQ